MTNALKKLKINSVFALFLLKFRMLSATFQVVYGVESIHSVLVRWRMCFSNSFDRLSHSVLMTLNIAV